MHAPRRSITQSTKAAVAHRYGLPKDNTQHEYRCAYCANVGVAEWWVYEGSRGYGWVMLLDLEWDHVIPLSQGGPNTAENLVWACRPCNRAKKNRTPEQWRSKPLGDR